MMTSLSVVSVFRDLTEGRHSGDEGNETQTHSLFASSNELWIIRSVGSLNAKSRLTCARVGFFYFLRRRQLIPSFHRTCKHFLGNLFSASELSDQVYSKKQRHIELNVKAGHKTTDSQMTHVFGRCIIVVHCWFRIKSFKFYKIRC